MRAEKIISTLIICATVLIAFLVFACARGWLIEPTELPMHFTRISDGSQISLRMHRDEIESVLGTPLEKMDIDELKQNIYEVNEDVLDLMRVNIDMNVFTYSGFGGFVAVHYNDEDFVKNIFVTTPEWIIVDWGAVGTDIQNVLDKRRNFNITSWNYEVFARVPMYGIMFRHDKDGNIEFIQLSMSLASGYFDD